MTMTLREGAAAPNDALVVALARVRARGGSDYAVAVEAGVHPSNLSRWKHGHRLPTRTEAEQVASVLGLPVDTLFARVRKPGDPEVGRA